ncbi:BRCA1-associated RING domain protein 1 [Coffea eugenioides]|uniref:BRCA1-associated RING domain protein 1 n=1 Tax=Coffea eugenioides TaxID=49369 RepID=UPI000F6066FE|nr:BRCA1-associated RING domain protein 1 [Coffea eugenioides]
MAEMQKLVKLLNPWALHHQKLGLELKCPLCLNLLNKPLLLPCTHIFCDICVPRSNQFGTECPACKNQCPDGDIRSAPYMENLVSIYRSLDATFANISLQILSSEQALPHVAPQIVDKLKKELSETPEGGVINSAITNKAAMLSNAHNKDVLQSCGKKGSDEVLETEEIDMNQVPQLSPESPPSFGDVKDMDGNTSLPGSRCGTTEKCKTKIIMDSCMLDTPGGGVVDQGTIQKGTPYTRDAKRQKMLDYGSSATVVMGNCLTQKVDSSSNGAISNCNLAVKPEEQPCIAQPTPVSNSSDLESVCAFCHSSKLTDGTGPILYYANRKEVYGEKSALSNVTPVHSKCIEWTPRIYFEGETIKNLESELGRAAKLKCSSCGQKGAALGCFAKSCRRTYHVPCAFAIQECRWDCEDFLMLCPSHNSFKFPREKSKSQKSSTGLKHNTMSNETLFTNSEFWATLPSGRKEWVFCGSALSSEEKFILVKFATMCGATVSKLWESNVTHVIAATDKKGACTRTLKVLMGILNGKWILTMDWVKACTEAKHPVNEEPYEVNLDNHGCLNGPKTGRLRVSNNEPKLFDGLKFYFSGDFVPAYKIDLLDLVRTAGGTILESAEQLMVQSLEQTTFHECLVVYNSDATRACAIEEEISVISRRLEEAANAAKETNSPVVRHTWILESIAACKLLPLPC